MGEVYRARDTRLGRDVAIKVLASGVAAREDALARFEQEARVVASLSHPNIVALYELGSGEVDGETVVFAATELLEGGTLREHLRQGAIPLRKGLEWTSQICRGLSAAHEKGIIHRDLKPENLFITHDGQVKILDFGLARLAPESMSDETLRLSKDVHTAAGTVMGTAGYMSPEQVRAEELDQTSDIFSLGVVLYEILAGRRAFERDTPAETMTAILREDPPDVRLSNAAVPTALDWIVSRCLEKAPRERFQSAHDLGLALQSASTPSFTDSEIPAVVRGASRSNRRAWMWGVVACLAVAVGVWGGRFLFGTGNTPTSAPISITRLTFDRGRVYAARFVGDERTVVYSATIGSHPVEVFMTQVGVPGSRSLELQPSTSLLAVSNQGELAVLLDSRQLAHFLREGTLARAPLAGGSPRALLEGVMDFDWAPDGEEYAVVFREADDRICLDFPVGNRIIETLGWINHPRVSPDGRMVAFLLHELGRYDDGGVVAVSDRQGGVRTLSKDVCWSIEGLAWSPTGDEIWFCAGGAPRTLHAVDLTGKQRQIATTFTDLTLRDVDATGRVLVSEDVTRRGISRIDVTTGEETDLSWLDASSGVAFSHDGRRIVFTEERIMLYDVLRPPRAAEQQTTVVIRDVDGSLPVVLGPGYALDISPDASQVIAYLDLPPRLIIHPTGAGNSRTLTLEVTPMAGASWTPDARSIVFAGIDTDNEMGLYVQDVATTAAKRISPPGIAVDARYIKLVVSPDSKHVLGIDRDGALWNCNLDGAPPVRVDGAEPGDTPEQWSADGRWLYVARLRSNRAPVYRIDLQTGARELWREIVPSDPAGMEIYGVFLTRDAQSLAYTFKRLTSELYAVEGWR